MNCSRYDDMICIVKFVNLICINLISINLIFMFDVRAEGEATITISIRHCCRNWWGRVKKQDFRNPVSQQNAT